MAVRSAQTLALQKQLKAAGFNPGPLDGIMGPRTRAAMAQQAAAQARQIAAPTPAPAPAPTPQIAAPTPAPAPAAPPANPLYSDPAFLAYAANSGRDYETAAADVQRKKAALEGALTVSQANIKTQGQEKLKSIYGDYASRGLTGAQQVSGQQVEDEGKAQAENLQQIAAAQGQTASQIEGLQSNLAQKRQDILAEASQRGYDVAGQQDLTNKLNEVEKKYPLGGQTGLRY